MSGTVQIVQLQDKQKVDLALERVFRGEHHVVEGRRRYLQAIRTVDDMNASIIVVFSGRWMGGGTQ
jgi:hypothetical protein